MIFQAASFLKFTNGEVDLYDASLRVEPKHLNAAMHGGIGIQHIADISLQAHHHVDYNLLIEKFPHFAEGASAGYMFYHQLITDDQYNGSLTNASSTYERYAAFTLNWISGGQYGVGSPLASGTLPTGFVWDSVDKKTFSYTEAPPAGFIDTDSLGGKYGFAWVNSTGIKYAFFSNPIPPSGVHLVDDVGGNTTLADHLKDQSIHKSGSTNSVVNVAHFDHMSGFGGYMNVYDLKDGVITYERGYTRKDDNYPINPFAETDEYYDLQNIGAPLDGTPKNDIAHPILYEEAYYMHHNGKIKQYKLLKADPDDSVLAKERLSQYPLDSLFVGGGVSTDNAGQPLEHGVSSVYSPTQDRYVKTINQNLDVYFYNNYYVTRYNNTYTLPTPFEFVSTLWTNGLGYQPSRGISTSGL